MQINTKDLRPLKWLGPFVKATSEILTSEIFRKDKLPNGEDTLDNDSKHCLGKFCKSFIVFRYVQMT